MKDEALLMRVLAARDARGRMRARMRGELAAPQALGELSLNVPGWPKLGRAWFVVFAHGLEAVRREIDCEARALWADAAGYWALFVSERSALACKRASCAIEDRAPWGRLLDLDWYTNGGLKLTREDLGIAPRTCLMCGGAQGLCISELRHDIASVRAKAHTLARSARRIDSTTMSRSWRL